MITKIDILNKFKSKILHFDVSDRNEIMKAYKFAEKAHNGQYRISGDEFIIHPIEVSIILMEYHFDRDIIIAALLHDTVEDNADISINDIKKNFNLDVSKMVQGLTKIEEGFKNNNISGYESFEKLFKSISNDIRIIIIKLADRLHNMRTISFLPIEKRIIKSEETLSIFSLLAQQLGLHEMKSELEDRAFEVLNSDDYLKYKVLIQDKVLRIFKKIKKNSFANNIRSFIERQGISLHNFDYRIKSTFSVYNKVKNKGKNFEEISDIIAYKIIVNRVEDCYLVLGEIHRNFSYVPGRLKDYISLPKQNGYQSLHTTILFNEVQIEFQIKTREMDFTASYGIASHWKYKTGNKSEIVKKIDIYKLSERYKKQDNFTSTFVKSLQNNSDRIVCLTPRGDRIFLPKGSIILDFAYHIHSKIAEKIVYARKNDVEVSPDTIIDSGDVIEIITSNFANNLDRSYLDLVKTTTAKEGLKAFFSKDHKKSLINAGAELFNSLADENNINKAIFFTYEYEIFSRFLCASLDDFYYLIGSGKINLESLFEYYHMLSGSRNVINKFLVDNNAIGNGISANKSMVNIKGINNSKIYLANCCYPIAGDEIAAINFSKVGFIVHRTKCSNLHSANQIDVFTATWKRSSNVISTDNFYSSFYSLIQIETNNQTDTILKLMNIFKEKNTRLNEMNTIAFPKNKNSGYLINILIETSNTPDVQRILKEISHSKYVVSAKRFINN